MEKDQSDEPLGPEVFTEVVSKLQIINSYTVQQMTTSLICLNIYTDPVENIETFLKQNYYLARRMHGSGMSPLALYFLVIGTFLS